MLDVTPNNQVTLELVITHVLNEESHQMMVDMDSMCNNSIICVIGKEGKRNLSCYWCGKGGHLHSECPNKTHNDLSSRNDSWKSEWDQKIGMKAEWSEKKKKEWEKLVNEVTTAVFTMYAPSDWLNYGQVLEIHK